MTRIQFFKTLIGFGATATIAIAKPRMTQDESVRLQSVYGRNLETAEVVERLHWPERPADAWGREEQYISGPYRITEIHVKVMEKV